MRGAFVAVLLTVALVACGEDGPVTDDPTDGSADNTAALERQRDDVRAAASALLDAARSELAASADEPSGSYRGCESAFGDEFRTFRYLSQARVDLAGGADPDDASRRLLEAAGFTADAEPTLGPGPRRTLRGEKGDLAATVASTTGARTFLLLAVSGPCLEVPEDARDDFLTRDS